MPFLRENNLRKHDFICSPTNLLKIPLLSLYMKIACIKQPFQKMHNEGSKIETFTYIRI